MTEAMNYAVCAILIGSGATAVMDIWTIARKALFGVPLANYGMVGRWIASMPRGRFIHHPISKSPAISGEHFIGWVAHYLVGIAFAAVLLAIWGLEWARHPALAPALIVGLGSVAAPFLLMQPGMGSGIAASKTPNPASARVQSVMTHGVFGVGLYAAGEGAKLLLGF